MIKKYFWIFLLFPLWAGSSYVVKDGNHEVGRMVTNDGSSEKEVVSTRELKEDAGGYTHLKASELNTQKPEKIKAVPDDSLQPSAEAVRGDYGISEGMSEMDVDRIASQANMGFPRKTTEYSAGETYPVRTWGYAYNEGGLQHSYKVSFDMDGKVLRVHHQTEAG